MLVPRGFRCAGLACGIKASGRPDLALVVGDPGTVAAGVYTQNQIVAAPVVLSRSRTPGAIRGVIINSGNANACTGDRGFRDAEEMTELAAQQLGCTASEVLVMSTGIIGHHLPMDQLRKGIPAASGKLQTDEASFLAAADAIMTTDHARKVASSQFVLSGGKQYSLFGMAKGAGMIGPNMATMLGLLLTDFPLTAAQADHLLHEVADQSFNCIRVEGHTSTNDSLVLMSSGGQEDRRTSPEDISIFAAHLQSIAIELAKKIPADGEGATHLIEIRVHGAADGADARQIAKTIADSPLVKTAIAGGDPNWGRIVSAAGYAGATIEPAKVALRVQGFSLYENGAPCEFSAPLVSAAIRGTRDVLVEITVGDRPGKATVWTSDLTVDYVKFNSHYST